MEINQKRISLSIAIGAIFGALSRFYLTEFIKTIFGDNFSFFATLMINLTGCLLIAYILTVALEKIRLISTELRLMTTTGFCGAYTTFSTYTLEAKNFVDQDNTLMILSYFVGSIIMGMICIKLGVFLARLGQKSD